MTETVTTLLWTDVITTIATCLTALATIGMAIVAGFQLSKMNRTINDSNLMSIFEVEFELNRRKERMADLRKDSTDFAKSMDEEDEEQKEELRRLDGRYQEAIENYLNIFDRLCYFILKNKLNEDDFRTEYRDMLSSTIREFEDKFGAGTIYRNMVRLNGKWADQ